MNLDSPQGRVGKNSHTVWSLGNLGLKGKEKEEPAWLLTEGQWLITKVQNGNSLQCRSADVVQTLFTTVFMLEDDDSQGMLP